MFNKIPENIEMGARELISDTSMKRPHVVILGAGASLAALPNGDVNGRKLPLMNNLVETTGLDKILKSFGIAYDGRNFEDIYSDLYEGSRYTDLRIALENTIIGYFSELRLPSHPTMYDHLVLSLREKDLVATFNWDPFLYRACWRNHNRAKLPRTVYLHGNVALGYCLRDNQKGFIGTECSKCGNIYVPSSLLFPIKKKDYSKDPFIRVEWETLKHDLQCAYMVTIFGYSAPDSDVDAVALLKEAWFKAGNRDIEQIEFIDIKSKDEIRDTWRDLIQGTCYHYNVFTDFYSSYLALFPRRTCEAEWNSSMECRFLEPYPIPKDLGFKELYEWLEPIVREEQ